MGKPWEILGKAAGKLWEALVLGKHRKPWASLREALRSLRKSIGEALEGEPWECLGEIVGKLWAGFGEALESLRQASDKPSRSFRFPAIQICWLVVAGWLAVGDWLWLAPVGEDYLPRLI